MVVPPQGGETRGGTSLGDARRAGSTDLPGGPTRAGGIGSPVTDAATGRRAGGRVHQQPLCARPGSHTGSVDRLIHVNSPLSVGQGGVGRPPWPASDPVTRPALPIVPFATGQRICDGPSRSPRQPQSATQTPS